MATEAEMTAMIEIGGAGGKTLEMIVMRGEIEDITRDKEDATDHARLPGQTLHHEIAAKGRAAARTSEMHDRHGTSMIAVDGTAAGIPGEAGLQTADIGIERQLQHES